MSCTHLGCCDAVHDVFGELADGLGTSWLGVGARR